MRQFYIAIVVLALVLGVVGCASPAPVPDLQAPQVTLNRVEVASYFPYPAAPPTPTPAPNPLTLNVPLVFAYIFDIKNPNPYPVTLVKLQFNADFEGPTNEYFTLSTPIVTDGMSVPGGTTNPLRVTVVFDTGGAGRVLAVQAGPRLTALNMKMADLIVKWWTAPSNPASSGIGYGLRVTQGTAEFNSEKGSKTVIFQDKFPK